MEQQSIGAGSIPLEKKRKKILVLLIVLASVFFLSSALSIYLYLSSRTTIENQVVAQKAITDKEKFKLQLQNLETEYSELGDDYDLLDSLVLVEKEKVRQLAEEMESQEYNNLRYKNEITKLEITVQKYREKIRDLEASGRLLQLNQDLSNTRYDSLVKIRTAEMRINADIQRNIISIERLSASGIKIGKDNQETPVIAVNKTSQIRICFRVSQNTEADKGLRAVYVRIIEPGGIVMLDKTGGSGETIADGKTISYSIRKSIYFDNNPTDMCLYFSKEEHYKKGIYYIDVFIDSYFAGTTTFSLE